MKIQVYFILAILFFFCSCAQKKNLKKEAEQPAFYNLMTDGDTLIIFRKHLYYWNDRGPRGEGRTYNEFIQRFIITKTATEMICFTSVEFEPWQFTDTLKFEMFQTNINYFDDLFDLNLVCADDYFEYPEICGNSYLIDSPLAVAESEEFQIYEQGWPEYYALRPSKREYFLKMQFQTNYNFFDVIMHFRGRVKRFYSENIPAILSAGHPAHKHTYPLGKTPIGKIKK
jgi:hypothetical protein